MRKSLQPFPDAVRLSGFCGAGASVHEAATNSSYIYTNPLEFELHVPLGSNLIYMNNRTLPPVYLFWMEFMYTVMRIFGFSIWNSSTDQLTESIGSI
jgi:hypothetical protein